jgi:hypothetical protein
LAPARKTRYKQRNQAGLLPMPASTPPQPPDKSQAETTAREGKWLEENHAAIAYWNERMGREGLLLAEYRMF